MQSMSMEDFGLVFAGNKHDAIAYIGALFLGLVALAASFAVAVTDWPSLVFSASSI